MTGRSVASSVIWRLMPFAHVVQFLVHGALWFVLFSLRKILQLRYATGFSSLVLYERSQRQSSLMFGSLVLFRTSRRVADSMRRLFQHRKKAESQDVIYKT